MALGPVFVILGIGVASTIGEKILQKIGQGDMAMILNIITWGAVTVIGYSYLSDTLREVLNIAKAWSHWG